jgi:ribosomal protein S8E
VDVSLKFVPTMPFLRAKSKPVFLVLLGAIASASWAASPQELELAISPSGLVGNLAPAGAPLLVAVRVDAARGVEHPVVLPGSAEDWIKAIVVELVRAADGAVVARAQPLEPAAAPTTEVDPQEGLSGAWLFPADATSSAGAGEYRLRATLGQGTSSELVANGNVALVASQPGNDGSVQQVLASATAAAASGDLARARAALNDALAKDPDRYEFLILRGQLALNE